MSDSKAISGKFRTSITHTTAASGVQGNSEYKVYGENTLRVNTDFTTSGSLKVQARIEGSSVWTEVGELTISVTSLSVDISTYDYVRFNFTTNSGSSGVIVASGFFKTVSSGSGSSMTDAEVKTAYENNADTNAFTDAEQTKLAAVEASATADQTDAEIKTAYENNADTNEFSDAEQTKLTGIETSATADQTDAEIKTAYENNADTNEFSDTEQTKLAGLVTATREAFFLPTITTSENVSYSIDSVGSTSSTAFTFFAPHDFTTIVSLEIIVSYTGSITTADIDLNSSYGAIGESIVLHQESDTASTYTVTVNNHYGLDASGVFSSLTAGDFCGLKITNNSITHASRYLGVRLRYT